SPNKFLVARGHLLFPKSRRKSPGWGARLVVESSPGIFSERRGRVSGGLLGPARIGLGEIVDAERADAVVRPDVAERGLVTSPRRVGAAGAGVGAFHGPREDLVASRAIGEHRVED